jgi:hypothetical protein
VGVMEMPMGFPHSAPPPGAVVQSLYPMEPIPNLSMHPPHVQMQLQMQMRERKKPTCIACKVRNSELPIPGKDGSCLAL